MFVILMYAVEISQHEHSVDYADEGMIVGGRGLARYGPGFANLVHIDSSCD